MSNFTAAQVTNANKGALRQLCRSMSINYANLDVAGMRAALLATLPVQPITDAELMVPFSDAELANPEVVSEVAPELPESGMLSEIPYVVEQPVAHTPRVFAPEELAPLLQTVTEPETAPVVPVPVGARLTSKGVKIEKDRPTQNGVRMPSAGTACRAVWDWCQAQIDAGTPATAKSVKEHANASGWNVNNASIEFYNWRKFNGVSGRAK